MEGNRPRYLYWALLTFAAAGCVAVAEYRTSPNSCVLRHCQRLVNGTAGPDDLGLALVGGVFLFVVSALIGWTGQDVAGRVLRWAAGRRSDHAADYGEPPEQVGD
jgi:hypothetical protein